MYRNPTIIRITATLEMPILVSWSNTKMEWGWVVVASVAITYVHMFNAMVKNPRLLPF